MRVLSSLVAVSLFTVVSCHVTVFRDGGWQVVPGRRSDMGGWDRFGFQSRPFGPINEMGRFGFGFPGQFQSPWNNGNRMWNSGFPQIPATNLNNPTAWINNGNRNPQNLVSDPWAQYRLLQNSANQLNPGTNNVNSINDINTINLNSPNPNVNTPWNTLDNPALGPNTGNQLPLIQNNAAPDQFGRFPLNSGMVGSPFNNQFQGNPMNGAVDQFGQFPPNSNIFGSPLNRLQGNSNNGVSFIGSPSSIGKRK